MKYFHLIMYTCAAIAYSTHAQATLITDSFTDTPLSSEWIVHHEDPIIGTHSVSTDNNNAWWGGTITWEFYPVGPGAYEKLTFHYQHLKGPHAGEGPGSPFSFVIDPVGTNINWPDTQGDYSVLNTQTLAHPGLRHKNIFTVSYFSDVAAQELKLRITAQHVPEPSALALLTTGTLAVFGYGWRRRRGKTGHRRISG